MIESITVANTATFGDAPESLGGLSTFNYVFGSNGTGKTTISRIIADSNAYPDCSVSWKNGQELETAVLNRDFVDQNFDQLKGVFTLGEKQKETLAKIRAAKEAMDSANEKLANLRNTLHGKDGAGGKQGELGLLEQQFQEKCWSQKQKHDEKLQGAFSGYRNSAEKFKAKVLQEQKNNTSALKSLGDLVKRAEALFEGTPVQEDPIPVIDADRLVAHESNSLLVKRVIGKSDVDIAAMIEKLGNSDWVRQGLKYYEVNDQYCPFCQQQTTDAFEKSLEEYFDETFAEDSAAIEGLISKYSTDAESIQSQIDNIIQSPGKFLSADKIESQKKILDRVISENRRILDQKKKEPSQVVELKPHADICNTIRDLIAAANSEMAEHNRMVENLAAERRDLTSEVWRFVLSELETDLKQYGANKESLGKAISGLKDKIQETEGLIKQKQSEIRELEKQTTSIQPTIDAINSILSRFGFDSFKLAMGEDDKSYRLVRHNGEDARETLSEGERTFVVFLYFYHLLKGSTTESGITEDRIVVFDDPVSSLDSDILFIVSSLIREVCEDVRQERGHVKQVFVLTHNIYFHREVTFNRRRSGGRLNEETFWIVRKIGPTSKIEWYEDNPIKTSYELLWMDVRNPDPANTRIENTLRRILEHYFTILGSTSFDEICNQFEGEDKCICQSLFSWVNAGSHFVDDDLYITPSDARMQSFLKVFREIFEKTNHGEHYRMMMGDAFVERPNEVIDE